MLSAITAKTGLAPGVSILKLRRYVQNQDDVGSQPPLQQPDAVSFSADTAVRGRNSVEAEEELHVGTSGSGTAIVPVEERLSPQALATLRMTITQASAVQQFAWFA